MSARLEKPEMHAVIEQSQRRRLDARRRYGAMSRISLQVHVGNFALQPVSRRVTGEMPGQRSARPFQADHCRAPCVSITASRKCAWKYGQQIGANEVAHPARQQTGYSNALVVVWKAPGPGPQSRARPKRPMSLVEAKLDRCRPKARVCNSKLARQSGLHVQKIPASSTRSPASAAKTPGWPRVACPRPPWSK